MKRLSLVVAILFAIILTGCSCNCGAEEKPGEVPEKVFKTADEYLSELLGQKFFTQNIYPNYAASGKRNEKYELHYYFTHPEYSFISEDVMLITDSTGTPLQTKGIPEKIAYEAKKGLISEAKVLEIARENNLPKGVKDWQVSFRWEGSLGEYIWHIISTEKELGERENYKAEGVEIMIDPISGDVIKEREWQIR